MAKIDVIIPVYNRATYLEKAVDSVLNQSLLPNKIIIVDDGSTDNTPDVIKALQKKSKLIISLRGTHKNAASARNIGIKASKAQYIAFLDSDDVWALHKLEKQIQVFNTSSDNVGIVYCAYKPIDSNDNILEYPIPIFPSFRGKVFQEVLDGACVSGSSSGALIKRRYLEQAGFFDENLMYGEDWDLWIRLAKVSEFNYSSEFLVYIRIHNLSLQRNAAKNKKLVALDNKLRIYAKHHDVLKQEQILSIHHQIVSVIVQNLFKPKQLHKFAKVWLKIPFIKFNKLLTAFMSLSVRAIYCKFCKKRIVVKIVGGLGNQMFQYATALSLARHNNIKDVYIDNSAFKTYKLWDYSLNKFNIPQEIHNNNYYWPYPLSKFIETFARKLDLLYKEPFFHFDHKFLKLKPPITIEGYFQSYKYFQNIADILYKQFTLKQPLSPKSAQILKLINSSKNSVSIHVRRGDYISSSANDVHGTLPISYYHQAVSTMQDAIGDNIKFFLFSDDKEFLRDNFGFCKEAVIVEGDIHNPIEDLFLMAACKHNIIANSTFSWWGAWLNQNVDKRVIAPKNWFAPQTLAKTNLNDLIPDEWILL